MTEATQNAETLGRFIAASTDRTMPVEVLDAARLCLADWLAVGIGAAGEDAGRIVRGTIDAWGATGNATVIFGGRSAPAAAALANGTLAHCLDFDDTYIPAITHASAPIWAAVLALGEARGASEDAMLRAFVTGFEVAARVGNGLGQALTSRGLHSTGAFGRIGAAAASAAMLGLDAQQAQHALATAATQASGLAISFGTMAKPFHAGKAAMDGVLSAELAQRGFVGNPAALDRGGLDKAYIQDGSATFAPISFDGWEILNNSFKPYAACHLVHPAVDAARSVSAALGDIRRVEARVSPLCMQITGSASGSPATALAAKFDLRYCIALGLAGRNVSAADFAEPWRLEPELAAVAQRIAAAPDPATGIATAEIDVEVAGVPPRTIRIETAKGHPGNPMRWDDMWAKLDALAAPSLGNATRALLDEVRTFGQGGTRAGLTRLLDALERHPAAPAASQRQATAPMH